MAHLGAEVGELHCFLIRERVDDRRVGHAPRVCAQYTVDIGPDVNLVSVQEIAEYRSGEIAAVAAEGGLEPAGVARDEAGDDQGGRRLLWRHTFGIRPRLRPSNGRPERPP